MKTNEIRKKNARLSPLQIVINGEKISEKIDPNLEELLGQTIPSSSSPRKVLGYQKKEAKWKMSTLL